MSSDNNQTIKTLEGVLVTVQGELDRLRADASAFPPAASMRAPMPPPPMPQPPAPFPMAPPSAAAMPPPPSPTARPNHVIPPPGASTGQPAGQAVTVNSPSVGLSAETAFRFGGISLVVLSAIFFVSTAISRGWIGPTAQLILATVVSLAFVAQSFRFDTDRKPWRVTFAPGGAAGLFISGVVGHVGLDILPLTAATGWLTAAIGLFLVLARSHESEVLAIMAAPATLIGMFLLNSAGVDSPAFIAATGAVWAILLGVTCHGQRWSIARSIGALTAGFIVSIGAVVVDVQALATLATLSVVVGIGALGALAWQQASGLLGQSPKAWASTAALEARVFALFVPWAALTVAWLLDGSIIGSRSGADYQGWAIMAVGFLGAGVATAWKETTSEARRSELMIALHQLAGIATMAVGLAVITQGPALLVGLLGAAIVSGVLARQTQLPEMITAAVALTALVTTWTAGLILGALTNSGLSVGESLATGAVLVAVGGGLWQVRERPEAPTGAALLWLGFLLWIAALWRLVPQEQMWVSISWVAVSVGLLASRPLWNRDLARQHFSKAINLALVTLGLTGAKLIFVDLVAVDVLWRAALFFVIGGTFLRLAFVLPEMLSADEPELDVINSEAT